MGQNVSGFQINCSMVLALTNEESGMSNTLETLTKLYSGTEIEQC